MENFAGQSSNSSAPRDFEAALRATLIDRCRLSPQDIADITRVMNASGMSFAEAAVHVGKVTQEDVRTTAGFLAHVAETQTGSPIQTAMKKLSSGRYEIVLREGAVVRPGAKLLIAHNPHHERCERLRALRTELLLLSGTSRNAKVLAVVGAVGGEGRSQLSAELAIAFAQLGRKTLLVDADMRNPSLHGAFESANEDGLAQALQTGSSPSVHPVSGLPFLRLLTAGAPPPNALEMLSDGRFQRLVNEWSRSYDFVIVDTPPISQYADGLAIATIVGLAIAVTRARHTPFNAVKEMMKRLGTTQAEVLGGVINYF
jgi:protein-tyrosine kinase